MLYILPGGTAFLALAIVVFLSFLNPLLTHLYGGALYAHLIKLHRHHAPLDDAMKNIYKPPVVAISELLGYFMMCVDFALAPSL